MSKKVFTLISGLVVAAQTAGVAIVTFMEPEHAAEINAAIVLGCDTVIAICSKFVSPE